MFQLSADEFDPGCRNPSILRSEMICQVALLRTESRGSHYRTDFPEEGDTIAPNQKSG
jgi:aspartate oxidase